MKNFLLLALFLVMGCKEECALKQRGTNFTLENVRGAISNIKIVSWPRGPAEKAGISLAAIISVDLPLIKKDDAEILQKELFVDSWLVQYQRTSDTGTETLGYLSIPLFQEKSKRTRLYLRPETVYFQMTYAAGYNSPRFQNFTCPAFNHRKSISRYGVESESRDPEILGIAFDRPLKANPFPPELKPTMFNGGVSLIGEYRASFALYNSQTKTINSSFVVAENVAKITEEEIHPLKECEGKRAEELSTPAEGGSYKDFRFGN